MAFGIDVSQWQSGVDYRAAFEGGVDFVIVKAGGSNTGSPYVATGYFDHVDRARAAGLNIGHYWFNGYGSPHGDAEFFVRNLRNYTPNDALVLDVENEGDMPAWNPDQAYAFILRVKELTGVAPLLYMSSSVTRQDWSGAVALGSKLWVAQYNSDLSSARPPTNLGPWGNNWTIWQYSSTGGVAGYGGNIDKNVTAVPWSEIVGSKPAPKRGGIVRRNAVVRAN